jgi:hypothetical protein
MSLFFCILSIMDLACRRKLQRNPFIRTAARAMHLPLVRKRLPISAMQKCSNPGMDRPGAFLRLL